VIAHVLTWHNLAGGLITLGLIVYAVVVLVRPGRF
jgi:hypothetical protein